MSPLPSQGRADPKVLDCRITDGFREWMSQAGGVLAISTYQAGKVVMVGWDGRRVTVLPRDFDKPMGLASQGQRLALATRNEVTLFGDARALAHEFDEQNPGRYDSLFLPRITYYTADLNVHDLAFGADALWLVATRFSCLATLSLDYSLVPRWHPRFVTEVAPGDRCHLNGLAMQDGRPGYVTAFGQTDAAGGWRETRVGGGLIVDVSSGEIVASGLCMPHSPRIWGGQLWFLNSGAGELVRVDLATGRHEVICVLPGYLRGLFFSAQFALVGLGTIREEHIFGGLPVIERFPKLLCGVAVIDLVSGQTVGLFEFTSGCTELYDVLLIPGIRRPMILSLSNEPVRQAVTSPEFSYWLRPSALRRDDG